MKYNKGDRVGAIISTDEETKIVMLAGYGVYQGEEVPPKGITFMGIDLYSINRVNPKIVLDNGSIIWGCQCWWGSEKQVKIMVEQLINRGYILKVED